MKLNTLTILFFLFTNLAQSQIEIKRTNGEIVSYENISKLNDSAVLAYFSNIRGTDFIRLGVNEIEYLKIKPNQELVLDFQFLRNKIKPLKIESNKSSSILNTEYSEINFYQAQNIFYSDEESFNIFLDAVEKRRKLKILLWTSVVVTSTSTIALYNGLIQNDYPNPSLLIGGLGFFILSPILIVSSIVTAIIKTKAKKRTIKRYQTYYEKNKHKYSIHSSKNSFGITLSF